jgi:hypothetical protein
MPFPAFSAISTMIRFFLICLGGAAGTGARYLLSSWMLRACGDRFPYVTAGKGTFLAICDSAAPPPVISELKAREPCQGDRDQPPPRG